MHKLFSVALLALFPISACASEVLLQHVFTSQGSYTYAIPLKRADGLPKWSPLGARPPLEVGDAIKVAMQQRMKSSPTGTDWSLGEVRLSRTAVGEPALVWFYQITLRRADKSADDVIVLMDGSIVTPQVQRR
jgi:hypothetical protein